MKKILVPIFGAFLSANAGLLTVEKGWNLFGSSHEIDLNQTFASYPDIKLVWSFENSKQSWNVYGNSQAYKRLAENSIHKNSNVVGKELGFWVLNDGDKIVVETVSTNTNPPKIPDVNSTENNNSTNEHNNTVLARQFLNVEANFSRTGNVVTDHVSGLKWEDQSPIFSGTFVEAETYCSNLELDGISDWRVPSLKELWYLADRNRYNSYTAINPVFQNTRDSDYWSNQQDNYSSEYQSYNWTVYFGEGYNNSRNRSSSFYTRCVAGESYYEDINFSRDDSKNLVTDNSNGLMWQDQTSANVMNWSSAQTYCSDLSFGGYSDWRLPNISELYSITDQRKTTSPYVNSNFRNISSDLFWSQTIHKTYNQGSWVVYFDEGSGGWDIQTFRDLVLCVRDLK